MSTFGNFALNLIGSAITEGITGNNTGYYQLGGYNNSVFTCGNNCNSAASEAARINNRADLKAGLIFGGVLAGVLGVAGAIKKHGNIENMKTELATRVEDLNSELVKQLGQGTTVDNYETKINENVKVINDFTTTTTTYENKKTEYNASVTKQNNLTASYNSYSQTIASADVVINTSQDETEVAKAKATKEHAIAEQAKVKVELDQVQAEVERLKQETTTLNEKLQGLANQVEAMPINTVAGLEEFKKVVANEVETINIMKESIMNGADKSQINRTSDKNFAKLFDSEGNVTEEKVSKRDIRAAIAQFRAASGDDRKVAASKLQKLWEAADDNVTSDTTLSQAYKFAMEKSNLG